jgi:DNA-binding MarR family transcriptional regulator
MSSSRDPSALAHHVGYWLRFVSNHVSHSFAQKVEAKGVTVAEWAVMRQMLELGPVQPSYLAEELGMTRGAISKLVERLRVKELVERSAAEGDRRYQVVELTAKGKRLVPTLARLADENDKEFFGHLSARQQSDLTRLLQVIVQRQGWKDIPIT